MVVTANKPDFNSNFEGVLETAEYTKGYKEECFAAWYAAGQPRSLKLLSFIPEDRHGRKPNPSTIRKWQRGEDGWNARAKALNIKTQESLDIILIEKRVEMFERHAETGAQMADMGMEYLTADEGGGIKSDQSAIRAIKEGTDLERKSLGISEMLRGITSMKDSQLLKLVGEFESENEDVIDAEFEEPVVEEDE